MAARLVFSGPSSSPRPDRRIRRTHVPPPSISVRRRSSGRSCGTIPHRGTIPHAETHGRIRWRGSPDCRPWRGHLGAAGAIDPAGDRKRPDHTSRSAPAVFRHHEVRRRRRTVRPSANQTAINDADRRGVGGRRRHGRRAGRRLQDLHDSAEEPRRPAPRDARVDPPRRRRTARAPARDGGFYDAPEPNLFVGLQDHGHSHWANSLIYGVDVENVMISGPGLIDGSHLNARGETVQRALAADDPREVADADRTPACRAAATRRSRSRTRRRHRLPRLLDPRTAATSRIIGTGVVGWTVDGIIVDTNRDAFDIDASQNVTVRNSVFNSLTDDAIVLKASFGLGRFMPTQNVLIENCTCQRLRRRIGHRQGLLDARSSSRRTATARRRASSSAPRARPASTRSPSATSSSIDRAGSRSSPWMAPSCATSS